MANNNKNKKPPIGGNNCTWNFKPCKYKKTIIKKSQYRKLPNGDIEIMAREDQIGFKTCKRTRRKPNNGGSGSHNDGNKNKTTKQLLVEFMDRQEKFNRTILARLDEHGQIIDHVLSRLVNVESRLDNLESRLDKQEKFNSWVKDVFKRNNLK